MGGSHSVFPNLTCSFLSKQFVYKLQGFHEVFVHSCRECLIVQFSKLYQLAGSPTTIASESVGITNLCVCVYVCVCV